MSKWTDADADVDADAYADADADADAVTPSNTRSYTCCSVPSSFGRSAHKRYISVCRNEGVLSNHCHITHCHLIIIVINNEIFKPYQRILDCGRFGTLSNSSENKMPSSWDTRFFMILKTKIINYRPLREAIGYQKCSFFFNIVQKAFDPPASFWTLCCGFSEGFLTKVRKHLQRQ